MTTDIPLESTIEGVRTSSSTLSTWSAMVARVPPTFSCPKITPPLSRLSSSSSTTSRTHFLKVFSSGMSSSSIAWLGTLSYSGRANPAMPASPTLCLTRITRLLTLPSMVVKRPSGLTISTKPMWWPPPPKMKMTRSPTLGCWNMRLRFWKKSRMASTPATLGTIVMGILAAAAAQDW
jgi:hypothetical protein